jgi:hypothetical protein
MMLNAHKDTDKNEIEDEHSYEGDPEKWKKRGNLPLTISSAHSHVGPTCNVRGTKS